MTQIKALAQGIANLCDEAKSSLNYKDSVVEKYEKIKKDKQQGKINQDQYDQEMVSLLEGRSYEEVINFYDSNLERISKEIKNLNNQLIKVYIGELPQEKKTYKVKLIPKKERGKLLAELNIEPYNLKDFVKSKTKKKNVEKEKIYTVYQTNEYGKIANIFFEKVSLSVTQKYPEYFKLIYNSLLSSDIKVLSKTYVSIIFFTAMIGTFVSFILSLFLIDFNNLFVAIPSILLLTLLGGAGTFAFVYFYPYLSKKNREKEIAKDLPFAVVHMSAVAGSGAQPLSIFNLLLKSKEYKGLDGEIKKIVNYVNVFGYDLSTALKNVADTTPSSDFRTLLNGLVSNIKSGGNLKDYLDQKSADMLVKYKLEREKLVQTMGTYADIYTGILIAAPLLFFTTLAIIQLLGGGIGGLSVRTLAIAGVFFVIPALNIGFMIFLNVVEPS